MAEDSLLSLDELLTAVDGIRFMGDADAFFFDNVQTDSRLVKQNSLFVPLIGEFQDGHKYIEESISKGATVIFVCLETYEKDSSRFIEIAEKYPAVVFIGVKNTLEALQKAAGRYVEKFPDLIKIAVTGSSGKTTTKEILASILRTKYRVVCNKGNFNSETGLPLSVFEIRSNHQVGLFEMGMNRENEIGEIAAVLKPKYAVVTNIGTAHIGKLGSRQNIANEKAKVFDYFDETGVGVIPCDDDYVEFLAGKIKGKVIYYGSDSDKSISAVKDEGLFGTRFTVGNAECSLSLPGEYNFKNALGAVALARELGLSDKEIAEGISSLKPMFGRSEVLSGKWTVIQDCYNANPDSMEKALEFAGEIKGNTVVLGDMLELGDDSKKEHEKIGRIVLDIHPENAVFVGKEMKYAYEICKDKIENTVWFEKWTDEEMSEIHDWILKNVEEKKVVLVKGSRGIGLERVVKKLMA